MSAITAASMRQLVVDIANGQAHERDAAKYWAEVLPDTWRGPYPKQWCGAFALWCLRVGTGCGLTWDVAMRDHDPSGFLHHLKRLPANVVPELGDIAYRDVPFRHHAVVVAAGAGADSASGVPYVICMNGNAGTPPEVAESYDTPHDWTCFYSIQSLVDDALQAMAELNQGEPPAGG
jgi:hypothetical protein